MNETVSKQPSPKPSFQSQNFGISPANSTAQQKPQSTPNFQVIPPKEVPMRPKTSMVTTAQINIDSQFDEFREVPEMKAPPPRSLQPSDMLSQSGHAQKNGMDPYGPSTSYMLPKPQLPSNQPVSGNCDISPSYMQNTSRQIPGVRPEQSSSFSAAMFNKPQASALSRVNQINSGAIPKVSTEIRGVAEPDGGYNFRRIMDDHFDHYKRPASREQSVDKTNLPVVLNEAKNTSLNRPSRQSSRTRTPLRNVSLSKTDVNVEVNDDATMENIKSNGGPPNFFSGGIQGNLKFRGPSQTIENLGSVPKRTESMYFKPFEDSNPQGNVSLIRFTVHSLEIPPNVSHYLPQEPQSTALKRKKSLPDVQNLVTVTQSTGSKQMTREEISVLSSSRRETIRREIEEIERYKNNPMLYVLNPRLKVGNIFFINIMNIAHKIIPLPFQEWFYQQRLMIFVMFLNLSLAIMFFKLLT